MASNFNYHNPRSLCTIARLRSAILLRSYDDLTTRHDKSKPTTYENEGDFQVRSVNINFRVLLSISRLYLQFISKKFSFAQEQIKNDLNISY